MDQNAEARCSQCGRPTTRSYEALEAAITQYDARGYSIESRGHDWVQMKQPDPAQFFIGVWIMLVLGLMIAQDPGRVVLWLDGDGQLQVATPIPHIPAPEFKSEVELQPTGHGISMKALLSVILVIVLVGLALALWLAPEMLGF